MCTESCIINYYKNALGGAASLSLYKLIVADDELFIRKGLKAFHWDQLGFTAVGAATKEIISDIPT